MSSEATTPLSDLPKLPTDLKSQVEEKDVDLKKVKINEKNVLPSEEEIKQEKFHQTHDGVIEDIESFKKNNKLNSVDTVEKVVLPTSEDILKEKFPQMAAGFDKKNLKHVEPEVKTQVEVIDTESK